MVVTLFGVSDKCSLVLSTVSIGDIWGAIFYQLRNFELSEICSCSFKSSIPLKYEAGSRLTNFKLYIIERHRGWCQKILSVVRVG